MRNLSMPMIPPLGAVCITVFAFSVSQFASAQESGRTGKEVADEVCAACHGDGLDGAPRIGDEEAWIARTSQGLTALTQHALEGIRQMPAHGGQPDLSDLDIARAITYMVNASGGDWVEPESMSAVLAERSGAQTVEKVCSECHQSGKDGAPKIGDQEAWLLHLRQGLPYAVHSAIRGHGGMPPRGGAADLTDKEIKNAILYMFNPEPADSKGIRQVVRAAPATPGMNHLTAGGMDIYLGVISAERIRDLPANSAEQRMHGGTPRGEDWYHVNISLMDETTHEGISNAKVDVTIDGVGSPAQSKQLERMSVGQRGSYGNYFRLRHGRTYQVTVKAQAPGSPALVEAQFKHEHY